jgi:FixJ family two-component response regulator
MRATVHIVDDDCYFRTAIGRLLEVSGFDVAGYASGDEILASSELDQPGCILPDLQMPGISGLELQRQLAEKSPLLPIVFLTGRGNVETAVEAVASA